MSHPYRVWIPSLALALGATACSVDHAEPWTSTETSAVIDPYAGHQGRLLLGFKNPDIRNVTLWDSSVVNATVDSDGQLIADGPITGTQLIGKIMAATDGITTVYMRIANVVTSTVPYESWLYALEQYDFATARWSPACAEPLQLVPESPAPTSPPLAIAIPGSWSRDGLYTYDSTKVVFACKTGVVAKCNGWGFAPSLLWPTTTENGNVTSGRGTDMLQACTRMARADFCALGVPNTLDGTPIHIDDIYTAPPPDPAYTFEAAWPGIAAGGGPTIVRPPPTPRPPAICLSKLRWATLPLGGGCTQLPDPRVDSKGQFCEDMTVDTMEKKGARTYSASTFIDAGLYTYFDPSTSTRLTTSNLLPQAVTHPPAWQIPQPPGVNFPIAGGPLPQFEATIFAQTLPPGMPTTDLQKLATYQCGDDLITEAIGPNAPSCTFVANEGYIYVPGMPGRAPLRRWYNPSVKRSYTTAAAPSTMIVGGWQLVDVVGAVIRATINVNVRWSSIIGATYQLDVQTRTGEWIAPCVSSLTSASFAYAGVCTAASFRKVDHADIQAFRITATTATTATVTVPYDGVASDVYLETPGGQTTAVAMSWNDVGDGARYRVDVKKLSGVDWLKCIDADSLNTSTSYIHTGSCPATGGTLKLPATGGLRVCATVRKLTQCAELSYSGATHAEFTLPSVL